MQAKNIAGINEDFLTSPEDWEGSLTGDKEISINSLRALLGEEFANFPPHTEFVVYAGKVPLALITLPDSPLLCVIYDACVPTGFYYGDSAEMDAIVSEADSIDYEQFRLLWYMLPNH